MDLTIQQLEKRRREIKKDITELENWDEADYDDLHFARQDLNRVNKILELKRTDPARAAEIQAKCELYEQKFEQMQTLMKELSELERDIGEYR